METLKPMFDQSSLSQYVPHCLVWRSWKSEYQLGQNTRRSREEKSRFLAKWPECSSTAYW